MTKRGFTLIELLVVIAIISLLSSIIFASVSQARAKARDSKRVQALIQVRNALELYRNNSSTGQYPDYVLPIDPGWETCRTNCWNCGANPWDDPASLSELAPYMPTRPSDTMGSYWYKVNPKRTEYKVAYLYIEDINSAPATMQDAIPFFAGGDTISITSSDVAESWNLACTFGQGAGDC